MFWWSRRRGFSPDGPAAGAISDKLCSIPPRADYGGQTPSRSLNHIPLKTESSMSMHPSQLLHLRLLEPATCENDAPSFASRQHELRQRHVARIQSMGR